MSTRDFFAKKEEFLKMASKSRKRYLARQYMSVKSMQYVPNQNYLEKIKENKEDLTMTKLLGRMLTACVRVEEEKKKAKSTDSVRLFAAEFRRLEVAREILDCFDGPGWCEPVDADRLELSISETLLETAARDAAAVRPEILTEGEKLPSAKLFDAIQWARGGAVVPAEPAEPAD